ncbi:MAG: hypothetical protein KKE29_20050 [Proteobacteria bacterium]|nr:hypothetical protein [Pseudomonadota bacterium]MBU4576016.1 hypothetical protein [Pseudomonadota bacterium]MBV1715982.1 hypothetical protein [Desulfarculus sp.]
MNDTHVKAKLYIQGKLFREEYLARPLPVVKVAVSPSISTHFIRAYSETLNSLRNLQIYEVEFKCVGLEGSFLSEQCYRYECNLGDLLHEKEAAHRREVVNLEAQVENLKHQLHLAETTSKALNQSLKELREERNELVSKVARADVLLDHAKAELGADPCAAMDF